MMIADLMVGVESEMVALAQRIRQSTVELRAGPRQLGAGVAWGQDLVLTNAHVATHHRMEVTRPDGSRVPGSLALRDPVRDLALLRVPRLSLTPVSLGRSDRLRPGMLVFAVGHPLGVVGAFTAGVVHAVGPALRGLTPGTPATLLPWLQADLEMAPGNSGGPVLDADGEVVGITTMIAGGLTLAVPGEEALRWATREFQGWHRFAS
jgi:serine protease Do